MLLLLLFLLLLSPLLAATDTLVNCKIFHIPWRTLATTQLSLWLFAYCICISGAFASLAIFLWEYIGWRHVCLDCVACTLCACNACERYENNSIAARQTAKVCMWHVECLFVLCVCVCICVQSTIRRPAFSASIGIATTGSNTRSSAMRAIVVVPPCLQLYFRGKAPLICTYLHIVADTHIHIQQYICKYVYIKRSNWIMYLH